MGFSNMWMSEPWMIRLLEIVVPISKGSFIDVGVNVGQTLLKLKSVSTEFDYFGFEPNPACIYYVNELVRINGFQHINLIPVGISSETMVGKLYFFDKSAIDSSASIVEHFRPDQKIEKTEYIPIFNTSAIRKNIDLCKIGIIKIDVEGGELEVLTGLGNEIIENQPVILIEILPVYDNKNTKRLERQNKIEQLFKDWKYSIFRVIKQNEQLKNIEEISEFGIHGDLNSCEYVAVPEKLKDEFLNCCMHKLAPYPA